MSHVYLLKAAQHNFQNVEYSSNTFWATGFSLCVFGFVFLSVRKEENPGVVLDVFI